MQDRIEQMEKARHRMMAGFLVAFVAWQVPMILGEAMDARAAPALVAPCSLLSAVAAIVWIAYVLRMWRLQRRIAAEPGAEQALNDERVREVRARASSFGFWAVLIYLASVRGAAVWVEVPAEVVTQSGLVVAVAAGIGAFLVYDRRG